MYYGAEKFRQMARSILPSTRRKGARYDLAKVRRAGRHDVNQRLRQISDCDDWYDDEFDFDHWPQRARMNGTEGIKSAVYDRRAADNVSGFLHWAGEHCRKNGIPREDRLSYIDSIMPQNLIGQHAVYGHLAGHYGFPDTAKGHNFPKPSYFFSRHKQDFDSYEEYKKDTARRYQAKAQKKRQAIITALTDVVKRGSQKKFNVFIKADKGSIRNKAGHAETKGKWVKNPSTDITEYKTYTEYISCDLCKAPRTLLGLHDVEAWVDWFLGLRTYRQPHYEYVEALLFFCPSLNELLKAYARFM